MEALVLRTTQPASQPPVVVHALYPPAHRPLAPLAAWVVLVLVLAWDWA